MNKVSKGKLLQLGTWLKFPKILCAECGQWTHRTPENVLV